MSVNTDESAVDSLLTHGVADVIVKEDLKEKLMSGEVLRIKLGIDPTGFDLHLGHMVVIHKLKAFQDMGHKIILLFGNFTGQIGDPTGKDKTRPMRTQEELENNAKDYLKQAAKILNIEEVEVRWNADWLAPLTFSDVVGLASNFTVSQMLERDMFKERIKNNQPISIHEFFYPLMQGYDSVPLEADVELGGTDQTFNVLAARPIQKAYGLEPQNIMTVPILVGTDGTMKMGKSTGNYIAVNDTPEDMYGKTMSVPDDLILSYFELAARAEEATLKSVKERLDSDENPRNLKMELAKAIVEIYHDAQAAEKGEEHFKTVFQKKAIPDEIEEAHLAQADWLLIDLISELGMGGSKSEIRRLIEGGAVKVNDVKISELDVSVALTAEALLLQVGKRKFRNVFLNS
jgi:tyrosyl-tRNA synthetase